MKRYNVKLETSYGRGYYDGDVYTDLQTSESKTGEWVKATEALKLQHRINRMQKRIDKLEGRCNA